MITTYLIGNGFDLGCGMRTRYADVYDEYCRTPSPNRTVDSFKKNIRKDYENWSDFEMGMAKYMETFAAESEFLECIRDFKVFLKSYLTQQEALFKKAMSHPDLHAKAFYEIEHGVRDFYKNISQNVTNEINSRIALVGNNRSAITFNYTDTLEFLNQNPMNTGAKIFQSVHHIHGDKDGIVLGVDNETQFSSRLRYSYTSKTRRAFEKPFFNESYDRARVNDAIAQIQRSDCLCLFGWSMGDSDDTWKKVILDWLSDPRSRLFVYSYKNYQKIGRTVDEKMDYEEDATTEVFRMLGVPDARVEILKKQVFVPCGQMLFNMQGIVSQMKMQAEGDAAASPVRETPEKDAGELAGVL